MVATNDKGVSSRGARSLLAPAKLNISLSVTGRRSDGYHLLEMINIPISLCDTLILTPLQTGDRNVVTIREEDISPLTASQRTELEDPARNLAARAVNAVIEQSKNKFRYSLDIVKRIPLGAGLGGGSSDAAAALKLALAKCDQTIDPAWVAALGLTLGADVPYFLSGMSARVSGIGEVVQPIEIPGLKKLTAVLFVPPFGISTAAVYQSLRSVELALSDELDHRLNRSTDADYIERVSLDDLSAKNDLEPHAAQLEPRLGLLLSDIRDVCAKFSVRLAGMTGSGSVCFALISREQRALVADSFNEVAARHNATLKFCRAGF